MSILDAKLEVEIDGVYKKISNIKEMSVHISYKSKPDRTMQTNDWLSLLSTGGTRDLTLSITGIISRIQGDDEVQLFDLLLRSYCGDEETQPVDNSVFKYKLTLPDGNTMETECSVADCRVFLVTGDFDEYSARLESCGIPNYTRINN